MAKVLLTRGSAARNGIRRDAVKPGQLFQLLKKDGSLGKKIYGSLGHNGRAYSVNMTNGELAGTANLHKTVAVVGKFTVNSRNNGRHTTTRDKVLSGEVFKVKGGEKSYLALGRLKDGRFASLNMADPLNEDYAVTSNGRSEVMVIGLAHFEGLVAG